MSLWDNLGAMVGFGPNPADAASGYLNQIPGQLHQSYDPYIKRGNDQYDWLNKNYSSMGQDPSGYLNQLLKNYQPSQSYKLRQDEATRAAGNSAAAGGTRGSLNDITNQSRLTDYLMGDDMQQYLQNVLGIQNQGMQGGQHFYDQGYGASMGLGSDLSNVLGTQATNAFQGQQSHNQALQSLFNSLIGAGGMVAGGAMAGGYGKTPTPITYTY